MKPVKFNYTKLKIFFHLKNCCKNNKKYSLNRIQWSIISALQINEENKPDGSVRIFLCSQIPVSDLKVERLLNRGWADQLIGFSRGKSHFWKETEVDLFAGVGGAFSPRSKILCFTWVGDKSTERKSSISIVRLITTKQTLEVRVCNAARELFMMPGKEKAGSNSDSGECALGPPTVLT